ncbi:MAG: hypothetical protein IJ015_05370 [Ruminococcus sp.]|nr:hypothetical protein [Ruminococcus sp.]
MKLVRRDRLRGVVPLVAVILLMLYIFYCLQPVAIEDTHTVEDTIIWYNKVSHGKGMHWIDLHSHDNTYRVSNLRLVDLSLIDEKLAVDNLPVTITIQDNNISIDDFIFWNVESDVVDIRSDETIFYDIEEHNEEQRRTRIASIFFFALMIFGSLVWLVVCVDELRSLFFGRVFTAVQKEKQKVIDKRR